MLEDYPNFNIAQLSAALDIQEGEKKNAVVDVPSSPGNCINSSATTVTVDLCTALDKLQQENRFLLYPIPAQNQLILEVIEIGNESHYSNYEIVNSSGQVLRTGGLNWTERIAVINLKQLPDGLYFIHLMGNGVGTVNKPIVISR